MKKISVRYSYQNDKRAYIYTSMPKHGFFLCHPERKRRIFAPSIEKGFFVTMFLRMTYTEGAPERIQDFCQGFFPEKTDWNTAIKGLHAGILHLKLSFKTSFGDRLSPAYKHSTILTSLKIRQLKSRWKLPRELWRDPWKVSGATSSVNGPDLSSVRDDTTRGAPTEEASRWRCPTPPSPCPQARFHSFLWMSNIPL